MESGARCEVVSGRSAYDALTADPPVRQAYNPRVGAVLDHQLGLAPGLVAGVVDVFAEQSKLIRVRHKLLENPR